MKKVLITFAVTCIVFGGILMGIGNHYDSEKPECIHQREEQNIHIAGKDTHYIFMNDYGRFYKFVRRNDQGKWVRDTVTHESHEVTIYVRIF